MGTTTWTITTNNATVWDTGTSTNLTVTAASATIKCTYSGASNTRTINTSTAVAARIGKLWISAGTDSVAFSVGVNCVDLDFTGFAGTWTGSAATNIGGSLTVSTGLTRTFTGAFTFSATSGTKTITSNGKSFASQFTFDGVGGTFQLADTFVAGGAVILTNGTWDTNSQTLSSTTFASSNSNTRVLTMGTSTYSITAGNTTVWNTATSTNLTVNAASATINCTSNEAGPNQRTIDTSTSTSARIGNLKISAGTGTVLFNAVCCEGLDFTGFAGTWSGSSALNNKGAMTLSTGLTRSFTGAVTMSATSGTKVITNNGKTWASTFDFSGAGGTWQLADAFTTSSGVTLTAGAFDANTKAVQSTTLTSNNSNTRSITLTSATWTLTGTGTAWESSTATNLTLTGGTYAFSGASQTLNTGGVSFPTVNFTAATPAVTISGNFTASACTVTGSGAVGLSGAGNWDVTTFTANTSTVTWTTGSSPTITSHGQSFYALTVNKTAGTALQMQDALTCTSTLTLTQGTFDSNGYAVTIPRFSSSNSNTRVAAFGSSTWTLNSTGTVWDTSTATNFSTTGTGTIKVNDASASSKTFSGGGATFYDLWLTGAGTGTFIIAGSNTFHNLTIDTPPHTVQFTAGTIQKLTGAWDVDGTAGNIMTLQSTVSGQPWCVYAPESSVQTSAYVSLQDSAVT